MSDTLYERYITGCGTFDAVDGDRYFAQSFTVGNTGDNVRHYITSVKLLLRRVNTPGMFIVSIRAVDGAGLPTGPDLTSGTYDGDTLTGVAAWTEIILTPYLLNANTKYAIVIGNPVCPGGSILEICRATSAGYGGGVWCYSTDWGVTWGQHAGRDFTFQEFGFQFFTGVGNLEVVKDEEIYVIEKVE